MSQSNDVREKILRELDGLAASAGTGADYKSKQMIADDIMALIEQSNREVVRGLDKIDTKLAMVQSVDGLDEDVVNMLGNIRKDLSKFQYSDREGDTPDLSNCLQVEEEGDGNG